ncbi:MAG: rhodanese-like domain-containing protein [Halocynthiibacter sp.]
MGTGTDPRVFEALPHETWNTLEQEKSAALVDVRTKAEWGFVGFPDLESLGHSPIFVEWASFPDMSANPGFAEMVIEKLGGEIPAKLFFLCRSGVRSLCAAEAVADALSQKGIPADCINVVEGFEGDLDADRHRGQLNGWKSRGLAWRQS